MSEIEDAGSYDAIIIGTGMAGLVAGNGLAKRGYRVLMLEKHAAPGGGVSNVMTGGNNAAEIADGYLRNP